jgi:FtsH ternary system domain X5
VSRAYRIAVTEQLRRHVQVEDGVSSKLEVLPILPTERMGELLGAELSQRGFQREGGKALRKEANGVVVSVDLKTGQLEVTARADKQLDLATERVAVVDQDLQQVKEDELRAVARADLERRAEGTRSALSREVAQALEARLKDLRGELDQVVNKVTANALKERAGQLGTIEEIHEDAATGSLTIKVKV